MRWPQSNKNAITPLANRGMDFAIAHGLPRHKLSRFRPRTNRWPSRGGNMSAEIVVGTILMEDSPAITQTLILDNEFFSKGWGILTTVDATALEAKVSAEGWHCFFLADEVR